MSTKVLHQGVFFRATFALVTYLLAAVFVSSSALAQPQGGVDVVNRLNEKPLEAQRNPLRRLRYFYEQRAYPNQQTPPGALARARQDHEQKFGPVRERGDSRVPQFTQNQWTPLGPDRIATSPNNDSGRVTALAIHPTNPNILYAGAATGGIWKTIDGGANWIPLSDYQCSTAVGAITLDPINPNIVYLGTGEQNFSTDSYYGCGVLKSTDGGANWTQLGAVNFDTASGGARIGRIIVMPSLVNTLLVASDFGLYRSTNGGASFSLVLGGVATDIVVNPSSPSIVYAALGNVNGAASNGVYKSTDAGITWVKLAGGLPSSFSMGRVELAIAASAPSTVIAAAQNATTDSLLGVWKTTDAGVNWVQQAATGASCATQCWYDLALAIDPTNANIVYFSGFNLYKSVDGGASFTTIGAAIHVDHHALIFQPGVPSTIFAGSDGGVYKSTNGGSTWTSLNTNMAITQFYSGLALHPTNSGIALGGTQDNGTLRRAGTNAWSNALGGDGGYAAIDYATPTTAYAETQWIRNSGYSGPRRTDNFGVTPFNLKTTGIALNDSAQFIPPLVISPTNPQTLYFGTTRVYKTTNRADSWTPSGTTLSGTVTAIAQAPSNVNVIYAGTNAAGVYISTNGNTSYSLVTAGLPNLVVTDFAVHPTDSNTAFVVYSGFGPAHVFKTTNAGASWTNISGNLPNVPVNAIILDPGAPTTDIYIGTDLGVYRTRDGGVNWAPFSVGLPNVPVLDLVYNPTTDTLAAATHGRGIWKASIGGLRTTASRDFNGDGKSDILWRNSTSGQVYVWSMDGATTLSVGSPGTITPDWVIQGTGDFNGDGRSDVLWRNTSTGQVYIWFMSGPMYISAGFAGTATLDWVIQGQGDFNGDGKSDILWRNTTTGQVYVWIMNGNTLVSAVASLSVTADWVMQKVGDFNGDGKADVLWRNTGTGLVYVWLMNGGSVAAQGSPGTATSDWVVRSVGDVNGDGKSDIVWRNSTSGQVYIWLLNGTTNIGAGSPGTVASDWVLQRTGDFNGDGKSDILWRNSTTGLVYIWFLNGFTQIGAAGAGSISSDWVIQPNGN